MNPPKNSNIHKDYINYIDTSSVTDGKLDEVSYLTSDFPSRAQRMVQYGDILYSSVRPNLKHYYYYRDSYSHPIASSGFVLLRNKDTNQCDTEFTYYYLSTKEVVSYLSNIAESSQATFPSFLPKDLGGITLPNVNVKTQRRIASILSAYDSLIENNQKRIKLLEQMAENLYKEWFVRFRFPGYETAEFEGEVPKGWRQVTLGEYANVIMGQSPESCFYNNEKQGLPFHQGVGSYGDFYLQDDIYSTEGKRLAEANSIIFSVRAPVGRINITLNKIILGRGVAGINAKNGNNAFLLWLLKHKFSKEDIIGNGSIFTSVTKDELLGQKVLIPTRTIEESFNTTASNIEKEIRSLTIQKDNLTLQRDHLLPRLMSGKLSI